MYCKLSRASLDSEILCRASRAGQLDVCFKSTAKPPHSDDTAWLLALWSDAVDYEEDCLVDIAAAAFGNYRCIVIFKSLVMLFFLPC